MYTVDILLVIHRLRSKAVRECDSIKAPVWSSTAQVPSSELLGPEVEPNWAFQPIGRLGFFALLKRIALFGFEVFRTHMIRSFLQRIDQSALVWPINYGVKDFGMFPLETN